MSLLDIEVPSGIQLPPSRGPWSDAVIASLRGDQLVTPRTDADLEDLHLALYLAYLPRLRQVRGAPVEVEWDPDLLDLTGRLEAQAATDLAETMGVQEHQDQPDEPIAHRLKKLVGAWDAASPPLSTYLEQTADRAGFCDFLVHRSTYHLIEADPHSFALPRLVGRAKAAMVEIQADEYGAGRPDLMHQQLFADMMRSVGLQPDLSDSLAQVPGTTLAVTNTMMRFATHRSTSAETIGHLCALEMTSTEPNARYARGLRRVFGPSADSAFFEIHVTADAAHEQVAMSDMAGGAVADDPSLAEPILAGAKACLAIEARASGAILDALEAGRSALVPR